MVWAVFAVLGNVTQFLSQLLYGIPSVAAIDTFSSHFKDHKCNAELRKAICCDERNIHCCSGLAIAIAFKVFSSIKKRAKAFIGGVAIDG